nr:putative ribonuclease H-like domain-containing protein [Tanacetum cinerariifolium]
MDVKSAFLYGTIDEKVYVMQPPRFQDPEFPDRVCKVEKAMYGLHQAPRAWYGTFSKYLLDNGFQRGTIDQTLFIRKHKGEFLLVQVYVDDIIFGSSNPQLCRKFEALMHDKFQMSAISLDTQVLGQLILPWTRRILGEKMDLEEPKKIFDALKDPSWVEAIQEELLQFKIQNVWILVDCPKGVRPIGIKWVLKKKKDKRGIVIRNKVRVVAQGYTQEEEINYEEVFALVARIKAIRLFLAYASFIGFIVYQMDVKSAFLYGTIDEKVYVMQPPRFQDPEFPDRVCKVEKAMYGLHQAPRAWYGTFSKYLLDNGFQRGTIDQTLFIRKHKGEFLLVQVYVDDIIFGSSNPQLCRKFEALMHDKFQMSAMSANTPMDKENPWGKDGP